METVCFKPLREQYDFERNIFDDVLLPAIKDRVSEFQIICVDFNNARCFGNLNEAYCKHDYKNKDSSYKDQMNYNLNIIKDFFDDERFVMVDMNKDGSAMLTYKGFVPNDHIFIRGAQCTECKVLSSDGLSDRDIVIASIILNDVNSN